MENIKNVMQELNQKLVDIWTKDKKEYISQIFSNNVNYVLNGECIKGEDPLRKYLAILESAFKDRQYTVHDTFFVEDRVIQRWTGKGVFTGPYKGIKPTQKPFEYGGMTMLRVQDNKIKDVWVYNNLTKALEETSTQGTPTINLS
jgi:steroid delta-isomerase-like uncharacterized protein